MIVNDLIAELPWIIFGVALAAVCVRLCWLRRVPEWQQDPEAGRPSDGDNDSSVAPAGTGESGRSDDDRPAVTGDDPAADQPSAATGGRARVRVS
jgi:hypothetical protein